MAKRDFAFGKENPEIFSARRIVVAPIVTVIGFVMMVWGILRNGKSNGITE